MTIPDDDLTIPDDPYQGAGLVDDAPPPAEIPPETDIAQVINDAPRLGELLRYYRETAGWSQHDLAWHSHVDQSSISQIESGKRRAHNATLETLSRTLAVPLEADWREIYDWLIIMRDRLAPSPRTPDEITDITARLMAYPASYRGTVLKALVALSGTFHDIYKRWVNR